ncbi:hypothetical protein Taro_020967, partial [Colocasia esculenta]|nr:hypothetical protein [Colocasia esculenta]
LRDGRYACHARPRRPANCLGRTTPRRTRAAGPFLSRSISIERVPCGLSGILTGPADERRKAFVTLFAPSDGAARARETPSPSPRALPSSSPNHPQLRGPPSPRRCPAMAAMRVNAAVARSLPLSSLLAPSPSKIHLPGKRLERRKRKPRLGCRSGLDGEEEYLIDAPVSVGDGFSFSGVKAAVSFNQTSSSIYVFILNEVKAHPVRGSAKKATDPIFGLKLGAGSQSPVDLFRWFCVESGATTSPPVILVHGLPSQAYSFRKVLPVLAEDFHAIAFDWIGFGFSDKPQPKYGFDYTLDEYVSSLESLIAELDVSDLSLVVQGYFAPVVVKYASLHQEKLRNLILINPPLTEKHVKLPSTLSIFSNIFLGEIFSQDPLRASDKVLTSCGPYIMKEEDAMVYRRPYLTSGSSGFALNAISRAMNKELKTYIEAMRNILSSESWKVRTTICWGKRDRWLDFDGVEDFCSRFNHILVELPMVYVPHFLKWYVNSQDKQCYMDANA